MEIEEIKHLIIPFFEKWVKYLNQSIKNQGKVYNEDIGFGEYVLINKMEKHYCIELLGFQKINDNPKFIIEVKSNNSELNFFINGGKKFEEYNGLKPIIKGPSSSSFDSLYGFSNLLMSTVKPKNVIDVLFDDISTYQSILVKEECDLPFYFLPNSTNIFFHDTAIISQVNGVYSFRLHSTSIIVKKNISQNNFEELLNKIFEQIDLVPDYTPMGVKSKFQIISELKSLAYHKVDETAIDKFIQLISDDFAQALGYKSAKSNIRLEIQTSTQDNAKKGYLTPDFLMEKEDGTYDILDLKLGLLTANFAFGDWTNSYFSSYAQKLLGQLAGYRRYFANSDNANWAFEKYNIKVTIPKLIGIAGNHNNFDRKTVDIALEGNIKDFNLISYNELTDLLKK